MNYFSIHRSFCPHWQSSAVLLRTHLKFICKTFREVMHLIAKYLLIQDKVSIVC